MPNMNFKGTNKYQKFSEMMVKSTHFTEAEIDRLAEMHRNIMVGKEVRMRMITVFTFLCRNQTATGARWIGRGSESFSMTSLA